MCVHVSSARQSCTDVASLSNCPSICLSVCLSACLPSVCRLSVCLSVCLSVTVFVSFRLRQEVLAQTSPQLVSLFATCAFILVQVEVVREGLAYTRLDWTRPPFEQQLLRLAVCERLLLAIELSSGLEEAGLCLQAVVMCYGVLAPLIQNQLIAPPLAKVHCMCML